MKRREVETQISLIHQDLKARIEAAPVPAVIVSFVIGSVFTTFKSYLFPMVLLGILAALATWLFSDAPTEEEIASLGADSLNRKSTTTSGLSVARNFNGRDSQENEEEVDVEKPKKRASRASATKKKATTAAKSTSKTRKAKSTSTKAKSKTTTGRKSTSSRAKTRSSSR